MIFVYKIVFWKDNFKSAVFFFIAKINEMLSLKIIFLK